MAGARRVTAVSVMAEAVRATITPSDRPLDRNDLTGAEQMLVSAPNRDAEWFFLSGVLSYKKRMVGRRYEQHQTGDRYESQQC